MHPDIALRSVLALIGLWFAVYYLWRDFRNDSFRDHVFSIRDEMFLYAAQGNISFEHPAYSLLRERMNGLLRHGHELTLTRMFLVLLIGPKNKNIAIVMWEEAVTELPEAVQAKLQEYNYRLGLAVLLHMVFQSFFRYMTLRPFLYVMQVRNRVNKIIKSPKVKKSVERLESETLAPGDHRSSDQRPQVVTA